MPTPTSPFLSHNHLPLWLEDRIHLLCLRAHYDPSIHTEVKSLLESDVNWETLLHKAAFHHTRPLVFSFFLNNLADSLSESISTRLEKELQSIKIKNSILAKELLNLVEHFAAQQITVLPYKGPVAGVRLYKNITNREFSDLDFLVKQSDLTGIHTLLTNLGYHCPMREEMTRSQQNLHEREAKEYLYFKEHPLLGGIDLEPHWSVTMRKFSFPIDYASLWDHAQSILFGNGEIRTFSEMDDALILCACGAKSQWKRLLMVCDFAESVRSFSDSQWSALLERAIQLGFKRRLLLGAYLMQDTLGICLPSEIHTNLANDKLLPKLARQVYKNWFHSMHRSLLQSSRYSPLLFHMFERPQDKMVYFYRTTTTPQVMHLKRIPLPAPLHPLYRLLVPVYDYIIRPLKFYTKQRMGR